MGEAVERFQAAFQMTAPTRFLAAVLSSAGQPLRARLRPI